MTPRRGGRGVRIGPLLLGGEANERHADVLRHLLALEWPWWVFATGSRGRVLVSVETDRPFRATYLHADQSVRIGVPWDGGMPLTIAHELGHAVDAFLPYPTQETKQQIAELLGADGWSQPGEPWHRRVTEAFAEWFAWWCGMTDATTLHPRGWSREPAYLTWEHTGHDIAAVVRGRLKEIRMFDDVDQGDAHRDGILWAAGQGLVDGYPDGTFRPDEPVTRGQLATILHRQHLAG